MEYFIESVMEPPGKDLKDLELRLSSEMGDLRKAFTDHWNNKDMVVTYVDGEVTCKYVYLSNDHARLVPENRRHAPILVTEERPIIGRVIKIVKKVVKEWQP